MVVSEQVLQLTDSISIALAYQLGGRVLDYTYRALMSVDAQGSAWHKDMLKAWTPENKNTDVPRMNVQDQYANRLTDRFLTSSDYLSLQNITFGYTLPKSLTRKFQIEGIRLYFVADNVALLTARKGLDPRQGMWLLIMFIHRSVLFRAVSH